MTGELGIDGAFLFDVSARTQIEVTGRDRAKFLHNFCTNEIKKLQPGQGCEAFVTNANGKVLGHIFVFAEAESLWLESVAGAAATLLLHLEKYVITEDVRFADRSTEFSELLLVGQQSTKLLTDLRLPVSKLSCNEHLAHGSPSLPLRSIRRVDWFGSPTWLLSAATARHDAVWRALLDAGATKSDETVFHSLRIAAGFPLYGIDFSDENLAQEVGRTSQAISFTKGCYLGQEPIARIDALGHVNRQLCRLEMSSGPLPTPGTPILDKPAPDGKQVGTITSSTRKWLGNDDKPQVLAYLRSGFAKHDSQVFVDGQAANVL